MSEFQTQFESLRNEVSSIDRKVVSIEAKLGERDSLNNFLRTVFVSLLGAVMLQLGVTVWYAGRQSQAIETLAASVNDHETRLRAHERTEGKP
jgi:hypothetical protein